jgi:hypothetical protein
MLREKRDGKNNGRIIIHSLAHHNPNRVDFEHHVFYLFNYAFCIGCFAFLMGTTLALILGNVFYYHIVNLIDLSLILTLFIFSWIPSIFQYSIQIFLRKPLKNRGLKFLIRFLYPLGSIIFIFKNPILGLSLVIPAGLLIIYIRKVKERMLIIRNIE